MRRRMRSEVSAVTPISRGDIVAAGERKGKEGGVGKKRVVMSNRTSYTAQQCKTQYCLSRVVEN